MSGQRFLVIITDAEYKSHQPEREALSGLSVDLVKFQCKTEEDVIRHCRNADAIITQYAPITRKVIEGLEKVKIIVRYGIGVDNIDLKAATDAGIFVANVIYDTTDVADHTVALILASVRKLPQADRNVKNGKWNWKTLQPVCRLKGKTLGIIGLGDVARQVAYRIKAFGVKIIAFDPYLPTNVFEQHGIEKVGFDDIIERADIITLHVALTPETRHMIGEHQLKRMKRTAFLINASRGAVVDEEALYKVLKEKRIACASLDVMEREPPSRGNPLLKLDNVIVTPHMAWYSTASLTEIQSKAGKEVKRVLTGQIPVNLVNKEVLRAEHT